MLRVISRALLLSLTVAACACFGEGARTPFDVSPSPSPSPAPAPAPVTPRRLTGFVLDGSNSPVSGATVELNAGAAGFTAISDSAGAYAATFEQRWNGVDIGASKAGYERTNRWVMGSAGESSINVRLHAILRVVAGSSIRLAINPDDSYCGFDYEYLCRTVRVTSPRAGLLTVEAVADRAGAEFGVASPSETSLMRKSSSLTVSVAADSETTIAVSIDWQTAAPERLTLNTTLR